MSDTNKSSLSVLVDTLHAAQDKMSTSSTSKQIKTDQKALHAAIEGLNQALSLMTFKPESTSVLLKSVKELQAALNNTAAGSHALIIDRVKALRKEFNARIVMPADDIEQNLGLKPGVLSAQVSQGFDVHFKQLLEQVVQDDAQEDLKLLMDTAPIKERITKEEIRLNALESSALNTAEKAFQIRRCKAKIDYLKERIHQEPHEKIEQFKKEKYEEYLKGTIHNLLERRLGSYAGAFLEGLKLHLEPLQNELMQTLSIEDDIERKIAEGILPNFERIMQLLFDQGDLEFYKKLVDDRASLASRPDLSDIEKQKLEFIKGYEGEFITLTLQKMSSQTAVLDKINEFKETFNAQDKLIQIERKNQQLREAIKADESQSPISQRIKSFSKALSTIISDEKSTPKDKLNKIVTHVDNENEKPLPKESVGNQLSNFFKEIIRALMSTLQGKPRYGAVFPNRNQLFADIKKQITDEKKQDSPGPKA